MKKKYIISGIGILIIIGVSSFFWPKNSQTQYEIEPIKKQNIVQTVSITGTVKARKLIPLRIQKPGQVQMLNVSVGDAVKSGDVLLAVDQSNIEIEIQQAEARVAIAQANLKQRIAGVSNEDKAVSYQQVRNAEANLNAALIRLETLQKTLLAEKEKTLSSISTAETKLNDSTTQFQNTSYSNQTRLEIAENNLKSSYENAKSPLDLSLLYSKKLINKADDLLGISQKRGYQVYNFGDSVKENEAKNQTKELQPVIETFEGKYEQAKNDDILIFITASLSALNKAQSLAQNLYTLLSQTQTNSSIANTSIQNDLSEISNLQTNIANTINTLNQSKQAIQSALLEKENIEKNIQTATTTSREAFNGSKAQLEQAQQSLKVLETTNERSIASAKSEIEIAQTQLEQAKASATLKSAGPRSVDIAALEAQVKAEEANLALAKQKLKDAQIIAPIDGIITEVNTELGENANVSQDLIKMMDQDLYIIANVSETDIAKIKIDQPVDMTFDALSLNEVFTGTVQKINPAETVVQGVIYYQIEVNFENDGRIRSGMTANIDVETGRIIDALGISPQAVLYEDKKPYVRVLEQNQNVIKKPVQIGLEGDTLIEIKEGLNENDSIILFEKN